MMAANYRHIGGLENRLGRHYSRFSASGPAAPLAAQSLARRKSRNGGSNRRSWAKIDDSSISDVDTVMPIEAAKAHPVVPGLSISRASGSKPKRCWVSTFSGGVDRS